jgi:hypothetical protein
MSLSSREPSAKSLNVTAVASIVPHAIVQANPNQALRSPRSSVARGLGSKEPPPYQYHLVQDPWGRRERLMDRWLQYANHIDFHIASKIAKEHRPPAATLPLR